MSLLFLSVDQQPRRNQESNAGGLTHGWSRTKKKTAVLFSFGSHVSNFQYTDRFLFLASGTTICGHFGRSARGVRFVERVAEASCSLLLRCSDEYSDQDSSITIIASAGSLLLGLPPPGGISSYCSSGAPPPSHLHLSVLQ